MPATNKVIPAKKFHDLAEYNYATYCDILPPDISFEDLFQPSTWAHFGAADPTNAKFKVGTIVRVIAEDGSYDLDLVVVDVNVGSVTMRIRPFFGELSGSEAIKEAQKIAGTRPGTVPVGRDGKPVVRVDHLPATGWRVIGVNGEVSKNHPTKLAAEKAMAEYLRKAHLTMPELPTEPEKEPKPTKADKAA